jgi:serine phosphatase RsbU (regulator of sigma subunit)
LDLTLEGSNVSRRHARVAEDGADCFLEDLGSSNGTFLNNQKISAKTRLHHGDYLRVGSHMLRFEAHVTAFRETPDPDVTIQRQTAALTSNSEIFRENAGQKLQAVLDMAHHLAQALDPQEFLEKLADQLLRMFPQADRAMIFGFQNNQPNIRVQRLRKGGTQGGPAFSRSILNKVWKEGTSILGEDTESMQSNLTLQAMGVRSLLSVPLRARGGPVFGAIQLDRLQLGKPFSSEDLYLLTAVALQVSVGLENANLHQELVAQERMQRDLALAREIQEGFLPREFPKLADGALELFGELHPAQEVSGDFYDCFCLDANRVAFTVADVSGKGMPAALFMTMIRALWRQLAPIYGSPAKVFERLNEAVALDNPKFMYVTMLIGIYDVTKHECVLARAGHPAGIFRQADGTVSEIPSPRGALIGITAPCPPFTDCVVPFAPGDTLIFYTDGVTEAPKIGTPEMFGPERLIETLKAQAQDQKLQDWCSSICKDVESFSGTGGAHDDLTLLMCRRKS